MKKLFVVLAIVSVIVNVNVASAQGLKYSFDSKVIEASSISLPQTSSLLEVLQTLPELLHRTSANMLDNYYMMIDWLPVGSSSDIILSTILLEDIDEISVSSSSVSNYENNGQGGCIKIFLKHPKKGFSGNAYGGVAYPYNFVPGFSLNYSNDKWSVRSFFTGEFSSQNDLSTSYYSVQDGHQVEGSYSELNKDVSGMNQLAKIYASYSDGKNNLNLTFYEKYDKSKTDQTTKSAEENIYNSFDNSHNIEMMFKTSYSRQFAWKGNFSVEALYTYNPGHDILREGSPRIDMETHSDLDRYSVSGGVSYSQKIGYTTPQSAGLNLMVGASTNYSYNRDDAHVLNGSTIYTDYDDFKTYYFSYYCTAQANLGKFLMQVQIDFQHYKYNLVDGMLLYKQDLNIEYKNNDKNYVGEFATVWNISKNHILRFLATRSLKRPTMLQLFPYYVYSEDLQKFQKGSYDVKPMIINSLDLGYIFSHDTGKNHWQASFDARFIHTYDNLTYVAKYDDLMENTVFQIDNAGNDNILNLDAMFQWKRDWFAVQATGNYFYRHTVGTDSYYSYYNFALTSQIITSNNWTIAMGMNHSTKTVNYGVTQPALTVLKMHIAKTWNRFTASLAGTLSLNHRLEDKTTLESGGYDIKYYVPVSNTIYAGVRYNF